MAMNETSSPLTFWVIGLCPTSGIAVDVIKVKQLPAVIGKVLPAGFQSQLCPVL